MKKSCRYSKHRKFVGCVNLLVKKNFLEQTVPLKKVQSIIHLTAFIYLELSGLKSAIVTKNQLMVSLIIGFIKKELSP